MSGKKVLVVEDDVDVRQSILLALELEKYEVFEAGNGQEALQFLTTCTPLQKPGCIILDLMMPVMDGLKFLELITTVYAGVLDDIPIIITTARGNSQDKLQLPHTVARIQKPMDIDELFEVVEKYCK
jgi:CheY-like chemotaxis protein